MKEKIYKIILWVVALVAGVFFWFLGNVIKEGTGWTFVSTLINFLVGILVIFTTIKTFKKHQSK